MNEWRLDNVVLHVTFFTYPTLSAFLSTFYMLHVYTIGLMTTCWFVSARVPTSAFSASPLHFHTQPQRCSLIIFGLRHPAITSSCAMPFTWQSCHIFEPKFILYTYTHI